MRTAALTNTSEPSMAPSSASSRPERCRAAFTSVCQFAMRGSSSSPAGGQELRQHIHTQNF